MEVVETGSGRFKEASPGPRTVWPPETQHTLRGPAVLQSLPHSVKEEDAPWQGSDLSMVTDLCDSELHVWFESTFFPITMSPSRKRTLFKIKKEPVVA